MNAGFAAIAASVVVVVVASGGCSDEGKRDPATQERERRIAHWTAYTKTIADSGVLWPVWESVDRALAAGDAAALQQLFAERIYEVGISTEQLTLHWRSDAIARILDTYRACGLAWKGGRLFEVGGATAVGVKNARAEALKTRLDNFVRSSGETPPVNAFAAERVLPNEWIWLLLVPRDDVKQAFNACNAVRIKAVLLAPMDGTWKVAGIPLPTVLNDRSRQ